MSQDSISEELEREILESQVAHQNLLDFSTQSSTLILHSPTMDIPESLSEWNSEQFLTIEEHLSYLNNFVEVLSQMKNEGPSQSGKLPKFPSRPKRKLSDLYGGKPKKTKTTMTFNELHEYLKSKIVDVSMKVRKEVFFFNPEDITSSASAIEKLVEGYRHIQRQEATSMGFNLQYGMVLEIAFKFYEAEQGIHNETWDGWLERNVKISSTYARRLREIARLLFPYRAKFSTVGMSFYEVFNMRKELKTMFEKNEDIRLYWAEKVTSMVPNIHQQQSQE